MIADFRMLECFDPLETPGHIQIQKFQCCLFVPVPKTRKLETFAAGSLSSEAARRMGRRLKVLFPFDAF